MLTLTILAVDDDSRFLATLSRNLELAGYHPLTASTGAEGLRLYLETHPDLVLLDLHMPDTSGVNILQAIRQHDPHAEVILITGHSDNRDDLIPALQLGISSFIPKPVNPDTLEHALRQVETRIALRRERDLLDRLMDTSPLGITVVNRDGQITFANERAERILGLTRHELATRTYNAPEWRITNCQGGPFPEADLPFARVLASGAPVYDARHAIEWPNGRRVQLSINGAPLTGAGGRLDGVVFTLDDVTERTREEERRIEALEGELQALALLAAPATTSITAQIFGVRSVREAFPTVFTELSQQYADILERALEQRIYKVADNTSEALRLLAQRLGNLQAGPRDVVEVHTHALREKHARASNPLKAQAYTAEGRLVALEVMGHLVSYYRARCVGITCADTEQGGEDDTISS